MFEFWIDGVQYADPLNWKEFTESIEYDDQLNVFLFKYETKLKFSGGLYSYIYNTRNSGGICGVLDVVVKKSCSDSGTMLQIFKGKIFIADCQFFIDKCMVECSIHDDSYASLLFNNKGIKVMLEGLTTKNGLKGNTVLNLGLTYINTPNYLPQSITMFHPVGGAAIPGQDLRIYYLHDVFNYLVAFLTDFQCTFKSDFLNYSLPITTENEKVRNLTITTGYNIRVYSTNAQIPPFITFQELFEEVNRLYPITLSIDYDSTGKPIIVIEDADYYRQSTSSISLTNLSNVQEKSDNALLYGSIRVGSISEPYSGGLGTYVPTKDIIFSEENYYLNGECNTSTVKNLFGEYSADTNVIQACFISYSTDYDNNIIFIEADPTTGLVSSVYTAIKTANYDNVSNYHYNDNLFNINVVRRNHFHNSIANSSIGGVGAAVDLTNNSLTPTGVIALDYMFNCGSVVAVPAQTSAYAGLTFTVDNAAVFNGLKYTASVSGSYGFNYELSYNAVVFSSGGCPTTIMNRKFTVSTEVLRYNSLNVLQETQTFDDVERNSIGVYRYDFQPSFTMLAGDYIQARSTYTSEPLDYTIASGCWVRMFLGSPVVGIFETTVTPRNSGVNSFNNGKDFVCNIITFNAPLSETDYSTLKLNINKALTYNTDGVKNKKAWIKRITRTLATSEMDYELISNITNSQ